MIIVRGLFILIPFIIAVFYGSFFVVATDVSVWQGQYFVGNDFQKGTYQFNFTVYTALIGGEVCYSNATLLTMGHWGQWRTEQYGVGDACNNATENYYLNINIDGNDQPPRRRLAFLNYVRKGNANIPTQEDNAPANASSFINNDLPNQRGSLEALVIEKEGIAKGQPVYIAAVTKGVLHVRISDKANLSTSDVFGIAGTDAMYGEKIVIYSDGILDELDTARFSIGDTLYLGRKGLANTVPTEKEPIILLGFVLESHQKKGKILIRIDKQGVIGDTELPQQPHGPVNESVIDFIWKSAADIFSPVIELMRLKANGELQLLAGNLNVTGHNVTDILKLCDATGCYGLPDLLSAAPQLVAANQTVPPQTTGNLTKDGCMIPHAHFFASRTANLNTGLEYSLGNLVGVGPPQPCSGRVVYLLSQARLAQNGDGYIDLVVNANQISSCRVSTPRFSGGITQSQCELLFKKGDVLAPRTTKKPTGINTGYIVWWYVIYDQ